MSSDEQHPSSSLPHWGQPSTLTAKPIPMTGAGSCRQSDEVQARIIALGRAGTSLAEIDRTLHRDGFSNRAGKRWGKKTDKKVAMRILKAQGVSPVHTDEEMASATSIDYPPAVAVEFAAQCTVPKKCQVLPAHGHTAPATG